MKWGNWMETEGESWMTYEMGEGVYSIGADGFFFQEVREKDNLSYKNGGICSIQTTYIEGRDKNGKILYRQGIDDAGRKFVNNEEVQ